jgi:predicted Holliday junction resolvase-like endonuclease
MIYVLTGVVIFLILLVLILIYVVVRLNKYIGGLEETTEIYTDRVDNLQDAMQRALKENLFKDGTLKKPLVSVDETA